MDIKEKYDEYEDLIFKLKEIVEYTKLEDYKADLQQMLWNAEDDFKEIEEQWYEEQEKEWQEELRERNREYREMVGF